MCEHNQFDVKSPLPVFVPQLRRSETGKASHSVVWDFCWLSGTAVRLSHNLFPRPVLITTPPLLHAHLSSCYDPVQVTLPHLGLYFGGFFPTHNLPVHTLRNLIFYQRLTSCGLKFLWIILKTFNPYHTENTYISTAQVKQLIQCREISSVLILNESVLPYL